MKKYSEYKHSGIEWIGEIPKHWEINRMKYLCDIGTGDKDTENAVDEGEFPFFVRSQTIERINSYSFDGEAILTAGDGVGVCKVWHHINGKFDYHQRVYRMSDFKKVNGKFLFYFLKQNFGLEVKKLSAKSTVDSLRRPMFQNFPVAFGTEEESIAIANYLDKKTAEIDILIEKKQQLIQLYKEERTATINQAVTKGLDLNVSMKDSGIEWLGEIPEHWEVKRVDWASNIVRGNSSFKRDELLGSGKYIALQYGKTYKVDVVDDSFSFFVNDEFYKESQVVSRGDTILISTSETVEDLGHSCYYDNENIGLIGGEQILLKPNRDILDEKYLYYYTIQLGALLRKYAKGLKVYRFNTNDLKQLFFAIPSKKEQKTISIFLNQKSIELDGLISKSEQEIELLKEYKTALISEVVLGKVDVREEQLD